MSNESYNIQEKIEKARKDLKILINIKGNLLDPKVTDKSRELDKLLNQYLLLPKK